MFIFAVLSSCGTFEIVGNDFVLNGQPFQYVSGSFHYFRQHPDSWEDTIKKMANGGLSCIQTYVPWNLHEPRKGEYCFEGIADLDKFLKLCARYNMWVILRPGPYICGEWDFGGFPYWMMNECNENEFRRSAPKFTTPVEDWLKVILPKIAKHMIYNGGNVLMVQIENEYGWFDACDHDYMRWIAKVYRQHLGDEVVLFTTDPIRVTACGAVPDVAYAGIDFGTGQDVRSNFEQQRKLNGGSGPYVNTEFYSGWLDHWEDPHHVVSADAICKDLDTMLSLGGSVNFYMYFGGTNFYLYNGANGDHSSYQADPTSYDYDAPLSEAGDMTYKWGRILEVIKKYRKDIPSWTVSNSTKKGFGTVKFTRGVSLTNALTMLETKKAHADNPMTFEQLDADYGFVLYETSTTVGGRLEIPKAHDRAYVYIDGERAGIVVHSRESPVTIKAGKLQILVEHMGRNNYGGQFVETKGLTAGVSLDDEPVKNWDHTAFNLKDIGTLKFTQELPKGVPGFYQGEFDVDEPADTFLNPAGMVKGVAYVNGFCIGRYWTVGPQLTLYIPKAVIAKGMNTLTLFEVEGEGCEFVSLEEAPQISIL